MGRRRARSKPGDLPLHFLMFSVFGGKAENETSSPASVGQNTCLFSASASGFRCFVQLNDGVLN